MFLSLHIHLPSLLKLLAMHFNRYIRHIWLSDTHQHSAPYITYSHFA